MVFDGAGSRHVKGSCDGRWAAKLQQKYRSNFNFSNLIKSLKCFEYVQMSDFSGFWVGSKFPWVHMVFLHMQRNSDVGCIVVDIFPATEHAMDVDFSDVNDVVDVCPSRKIRQTHTPSPQKMKYRFKIPKKNKHKKKPTQMPKKKRTVVLLWVRSRDEGKKYIFDFL